MEICRKENCTGCGACKFICPKSCIGMKESVTGILYPEIDESKCVNCGACRKVCPQINKVSYNKPQEAYAAWSADDEERRTSASGGIAAEIYKMAAQNGFLMVGAECKEDFSVELSLTDTISKLAEYKNSKYVFSTAYKLYPELKKALKTDKTIIVIGLPCQIAAVRKLFKDNNQLILIDIVCHGTTPSVYLKQHIDKIEIEYSDQAKRISFRDPELDTSKFFLSLYNKSNRKFYSKRTMHGDTYQIGYHRAISYRENCYNCIYAKGERISDITLSDYNGLGKLAPCDFSNYKVSSLLVNTEKGRKLVDMLISEKHIVAEKRPVDEPIKGDPQLQHPSIKSKARFDFEKLINKNKGDFEKTMTIVVKRKNIREFVQRMKNKIKSIVK